MTRAPLCHQDTQAQMIEVLSITKVQLATKAHKQGTYPHELLGELLAVHCWKLIADAGDLPQKWVVYGNVTCQTPCTKRLTFKNKKASAKKSKHISHVATKKRAYIIYRSQHHGGGTKTIHHDGTA